MTVCNGFFSVTIRMLRSFRGLPLFKIALAGPKFNLRKFRALRVESVSIGRKTSTLLYMRRATGVIAPRVVDWTRQDAYVLRGSRSINLLIINKLLRIIVIMTNRDWGGSHRHVRAYLDGQFIVHQQLESLVRRDSHLSLKL